MSNKDKAEVLINLFNDKIMKETAFNKYIYKKSDLGGSAVNDIITQFNNDRKKIRKSLREAAKVLHTQIKITI